MFSLRQPSLGRQNGVGEGCSQTEMIGWSLMTPFIDCPWAQNDIYAMIQPWKSHIKNKLLSHTHTRDKLTETMRDKDLQHFKANTQLNSDQKTSVMTGCLKEAPSPLILCRWRQNTFITASVWRSGTLRTCQSQTLPNNRTISAQIILKKSKESKKKCENLLNIRPQNVWPLNLFTSCNLEQNVVMTIDHMKEEMDLWRGDADKVTTVLAQAG